MIDLAWFDAYSAAGPGVFPSGQKAAGWPADMTPMELAAIQRPYQSGDANRRRERWALCAALTAACGAGELDCMAETKQIEPGYFGPIEDSSSDPFATQEWKARAFKRQW